MVWVLDLGLVEEAERELVDELATVDWDRMRLGAGGRDSGARLELGWYADHPEATLMKLRHLGGLVESTSMPCGVGGNGDVRVKRVCGYSRKAAKTSAEE